MNYLAHYFRNVIRFSPYLTGLCLFFIYLLHSNQKMYNVFKIYNLNVEKDEIIMQRNVRNNDKGTFSDKLTFSKIDTSKIPFQPENFNKFHGFVNFNSTNQFKEPSEDYSNYNEDELNESILTNENLNILKNIIKCEKTSYEPGFEEKLDYLVFVNYVKADHGDLECYEDVTLATHGGFTFLDNLEMLVQRWLGPISVAIYTPGTDFLMALNSMKYLRQCIPQSDQIRKWVTFHVYFHKEFSPDYVPDEPLTENNINCSLPAPYAVNFTTTYKSKKRLKYPVNVGRNIAREASLTYYVLSLDIELYPTPHLGTKFLNMLARNPELIQEDVRRVFAIKPFEIREHLPIPGSKNDLIKMLHNQTVIMFHLLICPRCHRSPLTREWILQGETKYMDITGVGKRLYRFSSWEAIFICTKDDPKFEERLTWEGKGDKMMQSYVMCLLDYEFLFLSNAFVVHRPGIKQYKPHSKKKLRMIYRQNKFIMHILIDEYHKRHGYRYGCTF